MQTTDALVAGSVGAIKASIQQKQEALEQLTNKADYNKALKEIEEEQKKLEAITGKQGGWKEKESAPVRRRTPDRQRKNGRQHDSLRGDDQ